MLQQVHDSVLECTGGAVATYIPELANAPADAFGIALATLDGHVYETGDSRSLFTIQSVSKPFVYALALDDHGFEAVLAAIGVEPTGDPFNSITVDQASGRPFNPMVNAGAIVAASLVAGCNADERFARVRQKLAVFAGHELELDEEVYASELATGDRNRAIAYFMRTVGALSGDVEEALEVYFRQCSLLVSARDLAVMSATLANGGRNPVTGQVAVAAENVSRVLTVMTTCGMYDYAGEWMFRVGLPAKSGVSGGIAVALARRLGIGLYSPRLDGQGNSVRGIAACERLSERLGLHVMGVDATAPPPGLRRRRGADVRSKRSRPRSHLRVLGESGRAVMVYELLSDQTFISAEALLRVLHGDADCRWALLDLRRVTHIDLAAARLLTDMVQGRTRDGCATAVVGSPALPAVAALVAAGAMSFEDADRALDWCEAGVLSAAGLVTGGPADRVELSHQDLLEDLSAEALGVLAPLLSERVFAPGDVVFDEGDAADAIYFVMSGQVTLALKVGDPPRWTRLGTVAPGAAFGELAALDGGTRSTRVIADTAVVCQVLSLSALDTLGVARPEVLGQLYRGMARSLAARLRRATHEIVALQV